MALTPSAGQDKVAGSSLHQPMSKLEPKPSQTTSDDVTLLGITHAARMRQKFDKRPRVIFGSDLNQHFADVFPLSHETECFFNFVAIKHGGL